MKNMQDDILNKVVAIINKCSGATNDNFTPSDLSKPLTGNAIGLSAIDLIYVLFEIESEYRIRISPDELTDYQFCSINGMCEVIQRHIK